MKKILILLALPFIMMSATTSDNYFEKKVIAKTIEGNGYYYVLALEDGCTYYCDFGFYSLVKVNDSIVFKKNLWGKYKFIKLIQAKKKNTNLKL